MANFNTQSDNNLDKGYRETYRDLKADLEMTTKREATLNNELEEVRERLEKIHMLLEPFQELFGPKDAQEEKSE